MKEIMFLFLLLGCLAGCAQITGKTVKMPVIAGTWYPDDKVKLKSMLAGYLDNADKAIEEKTRGLIVPHAGYAYSGQVAAYGYKQLEDDYDTVIVLAVSHHMKFQGASILNATHYQTLLGEIKVSSKAKRLSKDNPHLFTAVPEAEADENSLEIQLPFLQSVLSDFELVPIVASDADPFELADALKEIIDDKTLVIASSDLSHYHPYKTAVSMDKSAIDSIEELDIEKASGSEMCGMVPVLTIMRLAQIMGWRPQALKYANSGDITGDKSGVVGYASIAFVDMNSKFSEGKLSAKEKKTLLRLARAQLESVYANKKVDIDAFEITPRLKSAQGCFVTLNEHDELRGCIGYIYPMKELFRAVLDNAVNAALHDARFNPVEQSELADIKIEISVLSVPQKLQYSSAADLKRKLQPLIDGVVLKKGRYQSTFLPQVWEQLPDKDEFLSQLCAKAGLAPEAWKKGDLDVYTYQADVFSE